MKKILRLKLKIAAQLILARYKPTVIGITGSVGKTSARQAVYSVLSTEFRTRRNIRNYNNEIGLPMTIIGAESGGKNLFRWLRVFLKALWLLVRKDKDFPEILVLEMGIDRPGDMAYLLRIARPKIGLVTRIGESHLEFFDSVDEVKEEKGLLVKRLDKSGVAILNNDCEKTKSLANTVSAELISYGFSDGSAVKASNYSCGGKGVEADISFKGATAHLVLPGAMGRTAVYACLAGISAGVALGIKLEKSVENLNHHFRFPKGRMNIIKGARGSLIVDDTYNASPQSAIAALEAVSSLAGRKIAVLGDMLELGSFEEEGHKKTGKKAVEAGIDKLITIGSKARLIGEGAREAGMDSRDILSFDDREAALSAIKSIVSERDVILVKGSQGARMEKVVKEVMAEPRDADQLLVRQDKEWMNK